MFPARSNGRRAAKILDGTIANVPPQGGRKLRPDSLRSHTNILFHLRRRFRSVWRRSLDGGLARSRWLQAGGEEGEPEESPTANRKRNFEL